MATTLLLDAVGTRPSTRLDLVRTRPADFVLRLDTSGARRLLDEMKAGRVACCETGEGWHVWRLVQGRMER